jgi:hypothetical protein
MSHYQKSGQNQDRKLSNRSFENASHFKYLGITATSQNLYNLALVLYGCETSFLILREEYRLRVLENRVLRKILGPKGDEMTGRQRKLHNKDLHGLYSLSSIIRMIKSRRMK